VCLSAVKQAAKFPRVSQAIEPKSIEKHQQHSLKVAKREQQEFC
jgi:hypothetical protein